MNIKKSLSRFGSREIALLTACNRAGKENHASFFPPQSTKCLFLFSLMNERMNQLTSRHLRHHSKDVPYQSNSHKTHSPDRPATRPDPTRPDPTRPDPTRPDPTRPDPTRPDRTQRVTTRGTSGDKRQDGETTDETKLVFVARTGYSKRCSLFVHMKCLVFVQKVGNHVSVFSFGPHETSGTSDEKRIQQAV